MVIVVVWGVLRVLEVVCRVLEGSYLDSRSLYDLSCMFSGLPWGDLIRGVKGLYEGSAGLGKVAQVRVLGPGDVWF